MPLKYYLKANQLTPDPNDYNAVVVSEGAASMKDIVRLIKHRYTKLSESDIQAVLDEFLDAITFWIQENKTINTPMINVTATITGVFNSPQESFDPAKHKVNIRIKPASKMRETARTMKLERISPPSRIPLIEDFYDVASKNYRSSITSLNPVRILGDRLRFDEEDEQQGVFFINAEDQQETPAEMIVDNDPSKLTFMAPDLPDGLYYVEVRNRTSIDELLVGRSAFSLTVGDVPAPIGSDPGDPGNLG